jgi:hypothetical protein
LRPYFRQQLFAWWWPNVKDNGMSGILGLACFRVGLKAPRLVLLGQAASKELR